jgi:formiminoglutamate deiminase
MTATTWHASHAWLPDGLAADVTFVTEAGRFIAVRAGGGHHRISATAPGSGADVVELPGVVLPGLANAHSHAFHRALRGRTHDGQGSFWTWRERMYALAARLDPDRYLALARATYAEMALAGVTAVGEFHYLHHGPGGRPYADPNAMGVALMVAAGEAGIRLTLLDTCYLAGGLTAQGHLPLDPVQQRFGDGDVGAWADRFALLTPGASVRAGAAIHSVRAVPAGDLAAVAAASSGVPLHVHLSEQPEENEVCAAFYGATPTTVLHREGVLGAATTVVHATHVHEADVALLGRTSTAACFCPTTERDLADGIGPARRLADAGVALCLGSDQHAVIDVLEEARALEMDERLGSGVRGRFSPAELVHAVTSAGHAAIGWPDAGALRVGARADLVAVRLDTPRTAGTSPGQVVAAATAADVDVVVVDGRTVVKGGRHVIGDVGALLARAVEALWVAP